MTPTNTVTPTSTLTPTVTITPSNTQTPSVTITPTTSYGYKIIECETFYGENEIASSIITPDDGYVIVEDLRGFDSSLLYHFDGVEWSVSSTPKSSGDSYEEVQILRDNDNNPIITGLISNGDNNYKRPNVEWLQNGEWVALPEPFYGYNVGEFSECASIYDSDNEFLYVAVSFPGLTEGDTFLQRWDGNQWNPYPTIPMDLISQMPDQGLALDSSGAVYVIGNSANNEVKIYKWYGSVWNLLGGNVSDSSSFAGCIINAYDELFVAVVENGDTIIKKYVGGNWVQFGSSIPNSFRPKMYLDNNQKLLVLVESQIPGNNKMRLYYHNTDWTQVGGDLPGTNFADVSVDNNNRIYVVQTLSPTAKEWSIFTLDNYSSLFCNGDLPLSTLSRKKIIK